MSFEELIGTCTYRALYVSSFYGFTFGWSLRASGRENLPRAGPVLIVANHQSFFDPLLVGLISRRRLTYLARDSLFHDRFFGRMIRHFGAVPIDRGFGKEGLRAVLAKLERGGAVLLFPEGERTHDGGLQPLKAGVSLLIRRVTCPIVPVGIAGAFHAWPRHAKLPTPSWLLRPPTNRQITAAFGKPIDPGRYAGMERDEMLADLQNEICQAHAKAVRLGRGLTAR